MPEEVAAVDEVENKNDRFRAENYRAGSQSENTGWVADNQTLFSQINKNKIHNKLQNNISYLGA